MNGVELRHKENLDFVILLEIIAIIVLKWRNNEMKM